MNTDFKDTPLGLLPEEWEIANLGDIFTLKQGKSLSAKKQSGTNRKPFLRTSNVFWGRIDLEKLDEMDFSDTELVELRLQPGDLLVCEGGDIGRTAMWDGQIETCFFQNHLHRLRNNRDDIYPPFFMYWMQAAFILFKLYGGEGNRTTIPNLSQGRLKAFALPKPHIEEQRAIAHVLSTVRQSIEATERVIAAARELKRSLMKYLFTYGPVPIDQADQVKLKETEVGEVPEEWDIVPIGKIANVRGGKRLPKGHSFSDSVTPYPYIRVVDFANWTVDRENIKYLTPEDYERIKRYIITCDDVYISIAGTIGLVGVIPIELNGANLTENAARIVRVDDELLSNKFLTAYLASEAGQIEISIRTTKTSQPKLALARIQQIPVPLPNLAEQREIAKSIASVDAKMQREIQRRTSLEILFNSLLHNLMTGKVRVKDTYP